MLLLGCSDIYHWICLVMLTHECTSLFFAKKICKVWSVDVLEMLF